MGIYEELQSRGLIAQVTDEEEIKDLINNGGARFYIGFDPTADSLHVGHFMALCLMKRLQMAGNKPIVLLGGGTGMIGDPSGRTDMRSMLTPEAIQHNCDCFKEQIGRFIEFGEDKAIVVNNADWLLDLKYVDMLREVGTYFSVNNMLRAECYKQRMERGLSFFEFNYMIMQSYDFYYLHKNYGCNMQFGGNDQWSNMLGGTELIRKKTGDDAYAMTITLLLNSEGKKMGKTAKGAVWLDPNKTSPFDFYQYWRNVADDDVMKCLRMLTFVPLEEIDAMETWDDARVNEKKEILAYELTALVHGEEEAKKAQATARAIFSGAGDSENMPMTEVPADMLEDGSANIVDLLMLAGLVKSKSEARKLIQQNGVSLGGAPVASHEDRVSVEQLQEGLEWIQSLEDNHVMPDLKTMNAAGDKTITDGQAWITGKYAGIFTWDSSALSASQNLPDDAEYVVGDEIKWGEAANGGFSKVSMGMAVTQSCEHPVEAAALINFILNEKEGASIMGTQCGMVCSKAGQEYAKEAGAVNELILEANTKVMAFVDQPFDPCYESTSLKDETNGVYGDVFEGFSYDQYDSAEAAQILYDGICEALA